MASSQRLARGVVLRLHNVSTRGGAGASLQEPYDDQWTTDSANLVTFDRKTGARTEVLIGFASLPNGLVAGPDGALYTSNWGISFSANGGDGEVLRIVP